MTLQAEGTASAAAGRSSAVPGLDLVRSLSGYSWSVIGVTALGFLMRVFLLGSPPLWRDEAFHAVVVNRGWGDMLDVVRHDSAPPLSYVLVKLANAISSSPASLRMVSVVAGTAMVPLAVALGRRMGGDRAAIMAGAVMAVFPAYVAQARDMRMYALGALFVVASCLALWRAVERPSYRRLTVYALLVALGLYSSYFAVLAVAAQAAAVLLVLRPRTSVLVKVSLAMIAGGVALVPWLIFAAPQFQHAGVPFWVQPVGISRIEDLWQEFVSGDTLRAQYPHAFEINVLRLLACGGAALGAVGWLAMAWRAGRGARQRILYPGLAGIFAVSLLIAVSLARPIFDSRYAAMTEAPAVVAVGVGMAGLWAWRRPLGAVLAGLAVVLLAGNGLALGLNPPNDDIRPLLAPLAGQVGGGDYVAVNGTLQYFTVLYYTDRATQERTHVVERQVSWYDGTAAYRPDTWDKSLPDGVSGRIFVLTAEGRGLVMPAGFSLRDQRCAAQQCLQTWAR